VSDSSRTLCAAVYLASDCSRTLCVAVNRVSDSRTLCVAVCCADFCLIVAGTVYQVSVSSGLCELLSTWFLIAEEKYVCCCLRTAISDSIFLGTAVYPVPVSAVCPVSYGRTIGSAAFLVSDSRTLGSAVYIQELLVLLPMCCKRLILDSMLTSCLTLLF